MKSMLPWILVLGLAAGLGAMFLSGQSKDAELAILRAQSQNAETLGTQLEEATSQVQAQKEEIAGLRKDTQELLRLRNEIVQLRAESQRLAKEAQTAKTQAERAQTQVAQTLQSSAQQVQQLQNENQQLRTASGPGPEIVQRNACINNLRRLDGSKQQWALEHGRPADALPTPQDLTPYLGGNALPACPAGGQYTLNAINQPPTCSIPTHALPR